MRAQAADIRRKLKWKHRHGAIGEIDAGAPKPRFLIERRVGRDVVGHVRDMYLQFVVAALDLTDGDCVVEVARGFAVYRDNRESPEILSLLHLGGRNDGLDLLGLIEHFGRETMRQMIFANNDFDVDSEIVFVAQYLNHSSPRILRG